MGQKRGREESAMPASFTIRDVKEEDLEKLAPVCYNAFKQFHDSVSMPPHVAFSSLKVTIDVLQGFIRAPTTAYSIVAVDDETGDILGTGFLHHDAEVYSIAPICVSPGRSGKGIGKAITTSLINRAKKDGAASIRLTQMAANRKSFSLYLGLGFIAIDCYTEFQGTVKSEQAAAATYALGFAPNVDADVRVMEEADVDACAGLFKKTMGYDRSNNIRGSLGVTCWVATSKSGGILAYTTGFHKFGHTVAQSEEDFVTLFNGIISKAELQFCLQFSTRLYPQLARWALASKFSLMGNYWYMVFGDYKAPRDGNVYFPSGLH